MPLCQSRSSRCRMPRIRDVLPVRTAFLLSYCLVGMVALASILGRYGSSVRSERNELLKVEWLYRLERTQCSNQKFINHIEHEILHGNEKDFEEWKTIIVGKEAKGLEFVYFAPHDDWKPKPPKPEPKQEQKEQTPKSKNSSTQPSKTSDPVAGPISLFHPPKWSR